jgi:signal transduction histidine kinase/CheY-like chemotaxis protein
MHRLIYCMTTQHDWRFITGALVLCIGGLGATLCLMSLARSVVGRRRLLCGAAASTVAALTVWGTHYLAMLGYDTILDVRYDSGLTMLSLSIIFIGFGAAMAMALSGPGAIRRIVSGTAAAASVVAMHFVGLSALTMTGARITLDPVGVAAAVAVSMGFAALTGFMNRVPRRLRLIVATALGTAVVVSLHFGAMGAIVLEPSPTTIAAGGMSSAALLICLLAVVIPVIAIAAFTTAIAYLTRTNTLAQLREAIDAMPDGLGFYDANDRLVIWNARYAEVNPDIGSTLTAGMSFEEMVRLGLDLDLYVDAEGRKEEWLAERLAARQGLSSSLEQHVVGDHWLRVQDRRTSAGGTVTVVNDITDLKRDAHALAEARDAADAANRAKSTFLANMSHEIRTPLNGIIGLAQALARTDLTPDQTEMLDLIQSSGQTLQTLLSDILDLARVESGRVEIASEPYALGRAVQEAAQLYAASASDKGLRFFVDVEPEADVWVQGDVVRLKQILTNLVSNAVKFTGQGFVSLTAARGDAPDGSAVLRFTVEDTGVGFDAEARERLFTRFEQADSTITRRFGGTGLGLAICLQLAKMMDGNLDCESEPGGGSAFILTLPLIPAEAPVARQAAEADHTPVLDNVPVRVLLADDHPTNRRVVELILSQVNVELVSVEDGAQAVEAFRSAPYDIVLMDMQMPIMDGLEATREIRRHEEASGTGHTTIVMLTANALAEHIAAGQTAGADQHLSKPFGADALLALIADSAPRRSALAA